MSRLPPEELFHIRTDGLEPIGDDTLRRRIDEAERRALERQTDAIDTKEETA